MDGFQEKLAPARCADGNPSGDAHDPGRVPVKHFPDRRVSRDLKEERYHAVP
jgi:hypothetical protein